jgi:hypothetical protein
VAECKTVPNDTYRAVRTLIGNKSGWYPDWETVGKVCALLAHTETPAGEVERLDVDGKWPIIPPYSAPCDCGADDAPANQHDLSCPKVPEPPSEQDRLRDAIVAEVAAYTGLRINEARELAGCIAARWIALAQPVQEHKA